MNTVQEIEKAIEHPPAEEFFKLGEWFDDQRGRPWDGRIVRDAQSGRLEYIFGLAHNPRAGMAAPEGPPAGCNVIKATRALRAAPWCPPAAF